jgi:hypothetical protein
MVGSLITPLDAPNTSEIAKIHCEDLTVNLKLHYCSGLTARITSFKLPKRRGEFYAGSFAGSGSLFGEVWRLVVSREALAAANLTQFLFDAFASYIAVSAHAISCCGDDAWIGNAATPKLAVIDNCKRRPPLN